MNISISVSKETNKQTNKQTGISIYTKIEFQNVIERLGFLCRVTDIKIAWISPWVFLLATVNRELEPEVQHVPPTLKQGAGAADTPTYINTGIGSQINKDASFP